MSKITKYSRLSLRIERNILACYLRANDSDREEGMFWYSNANKHAQHLADRYGVSVEQACGVIAALSPGNEWGKNLIDADIILEAHSKGVKYPVVGVYGRRNVEKCRRILKGEAPLDVLGGLKVRSFYANLLDPSSDESVTIDRHAKCLALSITVNRDDNRLVKDAEYPWFAAHYRKVAAKLGIIPSQLQSTCWVVWRRLKGQLAQNDLPF